MTSKAIRKERIDVEIPNRVKRIGPFSQAIKAGPFLFTAGQGPLDLRSGKVTHGTIRDETVLTFENLKRVLEAAGTSLENLVKLTIFLKDFRDYEAMNEVRRKYVGKVPPVSSTVQVTKLYEGIKVEIDAIALVPENRPDSEEM